MKNELSLSLGRIKAAFSNLSVYFMLLLCMSTAVKEKLDCVKRDFLMGRGRAR